ncbi:AAA family ATPase [Rhodobaculum claviforme]|uniref:AAA family ATPase n=1 Tax=Rhodobaculum claviforme TaxID=1549854 RepID=UPI0019114F6E
MCLDPELPGDPGASPRPTPQIGWSLRRAGRASLADSLSGSRRAELTAEGVDVFATAVADSPPFPDPAIELPPAQLPFMLSLARLCDDPAELAALADPMRISALAVPNAMMTGTAVEKALRRFARRTSDAEEAGISSVWVTPESYPAGKGLEDYVDDALTRGIKLVFSLAPGATLPPDISALVDHHAALRGLDRAGVVALLALTHSATGRLDLVELARRLPSDEVLATLPGRMLAAALRQPSSLKVADALARLAAAVAPVAPTPGPERPRITLAQVHGQPKAVEALGRMIADLKGWSAGRVAWPEVPNGVILDGPPGTGKTLLASGLAGSADIPLVAGSYGDWQKEGHLGDLQKAMSRFVQRARKAAPCVAFIDELDSFGSRDSAGPGRWGLHYDTKATNHLLTCLTEIRATEGVLLIAATNHRDRLDPAVARAGRFDLHLGMRLPDLAALVALLREGLGTDLPDIDLRPAAQALLGRTGADVAALLRQVRARARTAERALVAEDLHAEIEEVCPAIPDQDLRRCAVHEAGHLVAGAALGLPAAREASINVAGGQVMQPPPFLTTREDIEAVLAHLMAGRAAERLALGSVGSGAGGPPGSDLDRATQIAAAMELNFGLGSYGRVYLDPDRMLPIDGRLRAAVERHLERAEMRARDLLSQHRVTLEQVAEQLERERYLDAAQIADLLSGIAGPDRDAPMAAP